MGYSPRHRMQAFFWMDSTLESNWLFRYRYRKFTAKNSVWTIYSPKCVEGCKKNSLFTNFFGGRRQNITLGFSPNLNKFELSQAFNASFKEIIQNPLPYEIVKTGPVMDNVMEGDEVNVLSFPTPLWHAGDGGRYIGTGSFNVTRDPVENWVNVGTYRVMVHDKRTVGFYISPGKHGRIHRQKYLGDNQPMPVCVVVGIDPLSFLMSSTEIPYGICEYDVMGAYRGKPIQCVLGKHTGLPFPAHAEIVIEGYVDPEQLIPEGPFGDWCGSYTEKGRMRPKCEVVAIYHRNNPIILGLFCNFIADFKSFVINSIIVTSFNFY